MISRLDSRAAALVVERLAAEGRLIDDGAMLRRPDFVVAPTPRQAAAADRALARVAAHLRQHGQITLAEIRDMFDITRPFAFGLLDRLEQEGIARRSGSTANLRQ